MFPTFFTQKYQGMTSQHFSWLKGDISRSSELTKMMGLNNSLFTQASVGKAYVYISFWIRQSGLYKMCPLNDEWWYTTK